MTATASTILGACLGLSARERFTAVTDEPSLPRALALHAAAIELGAQSAVVLQRAPRAGNDLTLAVAAALGASDVIVGVLDGSISHAEATRSALARGARAASMGGSTEAMLERLLAGDLEAVAARSRAIAQALTAARTAHVSCPRGTDLTLDLEGRRAIADDGDLREPGSLGNVPFGEGFIAPIGGDGTLVATTIARLHGSATIEVRDGALAAADGPAGRELLLALDRHGPKGRNLAELGVGAHHAARICGDVLEDEKVLGSAHIAFGASSSFGGTVSVPVHIDCVIADVRIVLDGDPFDPSR
jgi:leucyl aminopeptidase (aminopeptidase T)